MHCENSLSKLKLWRWVEEGTTMHDQGMLIVLLWIKHRGNVHQLLRLKDQKEQVTERMGQFDLNVRIGLLCPIAAAEEKYPQPLLVRNFIIWKRSQEKGWLEAAFCMCYNSYFASISSTAQVGICFLFFYSWLVNTFRLITLAFNALCSCCMFGMFDWIVMNIIKEYRVQSILVGYVDLYFSVSHCAFLISLILNMNDGWSTTATHMHVGRWQSNTFHYALWGSHGYSFTSLREDDISSGSPSVVSI